MNLNLLDITIIVILAFYLISGMYRGFITSLLGTVGLHLCERYPQRALPALVLRDVTLERSSVASLASDVSPKRALLVMTMV